MPSLFAHSTVNEHSGVQFFANMDNVESTLMYLARVSLRYIFRSGIAGLTGMCILTLVGNAKQIPSVVVPAYTPASLLLPSHMASGDHQTYPLIWGGDVADGVQTVVFSLALFFPAYD